MSKGKGLVLVLCAAVLSSGISYGVTPDRIAADVVNGPKVHLKGNMHGMARPEFDLGRSDGNRLIQGISIAFRPSPTQQKDLDQFIAQLGDRKSPNYHKYLTPAQFGERFGMSLNDIAKITAWLQAQGFANIRVANGRNQISFDGTVAQIESTFAVEMHNYAVNGVVHTANAGEPAIPGILGEAVIGVGHLNDFAPKPRAKIQSHLTSYVSGNHLLTPADFATIYNINQLYAANVDGTGQKIAIVGQSAVKPADLNHFRSAAGLPASTVTMTLAGGTSAVCSGGDEAESDLDIEWSGGVAKGASIIFVYAGLVSNDSCGGKRTNSVWDALHYAIQHNTAPFVSTSYGYCESGLGSAFATQVRGWAQQAQSQGQTIVAASGDSGAADCDTGGAAIHGSEVDVPASIPEVTGAGGNEYTDDTPNCTGPSYCPPGDDPPYWSAAGATSDTVSSALKYIPEISWNNTSQTNSGTSPLFSASGGGGSIYFCTGISTCVTNSGKPIWQTGTGVPADGKRDVPDISLNASNVHDPYLTCSEDSQSGVSSCSVDFRDSAGGSFTAVGGTSAAAPTFAAVLALVNQFVGSTGLAPVNPTLYSLAASNPLVFHDITTGDNNVPCTAGTPDCPTGTTSIGFTAGLGYDQVTGLGSVDAFALAQALAPFSLSAATFTPSSVAAGTSATTTVTVTPNNGFNGTVSFSCSGLPAGATCTFNPTTVTGGSGTTQLTVLTAPNTATGAASVTIKGASGTPSIAITATLAITKTAVSFSLLPNPSLATLSVARGQTSGAITLNVNSTSTPAFVSANGSGSTTILPVTYSCVGLPSESSCNFSPSTTTSAIAVSLTVTTTAPTAKLQGPMDRASKIFYAVLFPGLFGILFTPLSRKGSSVRMLTLIAVLGLSTLWISSCGGTSSTKDPGTPTGSFPVTVNATTGGSAPLKSSFQFTLAVTP